MIQFPCVCGKTLTVADRLAGKLVRCPQCSQPVRLPDPAAQATLPPRADGNEATVPPADPPGMGSTLPPAGPHPGGERTSTADIPGYEILSELGRGGMGVVYQARQLQLNRVVALKMILAGGHASAADLVRFLAEAEAVATLQHPNIVQVYEVGHHRQLPFMALEFVEGGSLAGLLKDGPLAAKKAARLVEQMAHGMNAAHQAGIVHRDLKPDNVLLTKDGVPKVTDFGLAKRVEGGSGLTQTGAIMGTPSYMAPEQASGEGKRVGPAADVYALGAVLYCGLTGRPPFQAGTPLDTILQVVSEEPKPPRQLNPKVPRDLETICLKCLDKDPFGRYASAAALAEDLRRWQDGEPITARPAGRVERFVKWARRKPAAATIWAMMGVFVLLVSIGGPIIAWQQAELRKDALEEKGKADKQRIIAEEEKEKAREQLRKAQGLVYGGKLALAQQAFREGDGELALQYLNECQWDLCGWEHHHLWTRFNAKQTFYGPSDNGPSIITKNKPTRISSDLAYSPDGQRLAGIVAGKLVRWEAATGEAVVIYPGTKDPGFSVAYSPNGRHFALGSVGMVKLFDAATGKEVGTLKGHNGPVIFVAYSPDGRHLASIGLDKSMKVWDAATGKELHILNGHTGVFRSAFSPDGKYLATVEDKLVKLWDTVTGRGVRTFPGHKGGIHSVSFTPDGKRLVSVGLVMSMQGLSGEVKVWDTATGQEIRTLQGHKGIVTYAAFSPDGKFLATGGEKSVTIWDAATGEKVGALHGHKGLVHGLAFSPGGQRLASAGAFDAITPVEVKVWDALEWQENRTFRGHKGVVHGAVFSPDGQRLASISLDPANENLPGEVKIWNAASGREVFSIRGEKVLVAAAAFSPDGKRLATAGYDRTVRLWDAATGVELHTLPGFKTSMANLIFSPDGRWLAAAIEDVNRTVKVWDAATGQGIHTFTLPVPLPRTALTPPVTGIAFSPDGKRIAAATADQTVKVWDAATGHNIHTLKIQDVFTLPGLPPATRIAFSPDGKRLAVTAGDRTVKVWDLATGKDLLTFQGHTATVTSVAFSPDGQRLVTASWDKTVKLWDVATGQDLLTLQGHTGTATFVVFSPDGKRLATTGGDGTVKVWDAYKGQSTRLLAGQSLPVAGVAFSPDGERIFGWDSKKNVLAWSSRSGQLTDAADPPAFTATTTATRPDGNLRVEVLSDWQGSTVSATDQRLVDPHGNAWLLPDAEERHWYHSTRAESAGSGGEWFAAGFHLGKAADCAPWDAGARLAAADAWVKAGQHERAAGAFVRAVLVDPALGPR